MSWCQQSPLLDNASAQGMGQLCTPCPTACQLGHHSRALGGLGEAAEPSFSHRIHTEVSKPEPGKVTFAGRTALPLESCTQQGWDWARSREERKVCTSGTDLENVSVHPRHSWGLFLPVANAEGNASVLPQARMGHSTCTHRCRASPTSQVFHSNTGQ